jgi:hypothetical protein
VSNDKHTRLSIQPGFQLQSHKCEAWLISLHLQQEEESYEQAIGMVTTSTPTKSYWDFSNKEISPFQPKTDLVPGSPVISSSAERSFWDARRLIVSISVLQMENTLSQTLQLACVELLVGLNLWFLDGKHIGRSIQTPTVLNSICKGRYERC